MNTSCKKTLKLLDRNEQKTKMEDNNDHYFSDLLHNFVIIVLLQSLFNLFLSMIGSNCRIERLRVQVVGSNGRVERLSVWIGSNGRVERLRVQNLVVVVHSSDLLLGNVTTKRNNKDKHILCFLQVLIAQK